jgi:hypothetical protein
MTYFLSKHFGYENMSIQALIMITNFQYGGNAVHYKDDSKQDYHVSLHLGLTDYRLV